MKLLLILALAIAANAQEVKKADPAKAEAPKGGKLSELEQEKFLRMNAQIQLIQTQAQDQIQKLSDERQTLAKNICDRFKLELSSCVIDPQTAAVSAKPTEPAPPAK